MPSRQHLVNCIQSVDQCQLQLELGLAAFLEVLKGLRCKKAFCFANGGALCLPE